METMTDFIFLGSKITEDGDCSHEIKRRCSLEGKLDSVLKSRDITLPTKVHIVTALVFPVVMYRCELDHKEGWAPKNWSFQTVLEKTLESLGKAMVFPVVTYGCESWTIKKAEWGRIDAFELWCWRRLLRVPWTARRSNQSVLKEINLEYSLEALMPQLQYFGHLMQRIDPLEKTLMLGEIEGKRKRGQQRMRWLDSITDSTDMIWANPGR